MVRWHARALLFLSLLWPLGAVAQMEDRAYIGETAGVVVTNVYPTGLDLGAKTQNGTLFRIAGVPIDVAGDGTRCGADVHSVEISGDGGVTRIELRVPKAPVSGCPLPERQLKMVLPIAIPDSGQQVGGVKRMIKLRYRRINAEGERVYFFKVFRIEYLKNGDGDASVRITDPYRQ